MLLWENNTTLPSVHIIYILQTGSFAIDEEHFHYHAVMMGNNTPLQYWDTETVIPWVATTSLSPRTVMLWVTATLFHIATVFLRVKPLYYQMGKLRLSYTPPSYLCCVTTYRWTKLPLPYWRCVTLSDKTIILAHYSDGGTPAAINVLHCHLGWPKCPSGPKVKLGGQMTELNNIPNLRLG